VLNVHRDKFSPYSAKHLLLFALIAYRFARFFWRFRGLENEVALVLNLSRCQLNVLWMSLIIYQKDNNWKCIILNLIYMAWYFINYLCWQRVCYQVFQNYFLSINLNTQFYSNLCNDSYSPSFLPCKHDISAKVNNAISCVIDMYVQALCIYTYVRSRNRNGALFVSWCLCSTLCTYIFYRV